jgi:hypothetical protein
MRRLALVLEGVCLGLAAGVTLPLAIDNVTFGKPAEVFGIFLHQPMDQALFRRLQECAIAAANTFARVEIAIVKPGG